MTRKEIILLFVDCALELSEKGKDPHLYYQDNANLLQIYGWPDGKDNESTKLLDLYLDREQPYTEEEVVGRLNAFKLSCGIR